ncbi:MAG: M23 family metallopeptidase [Bacteroidales bacterium]|nr:M23 family metallopeptidase [Bacteroidales bacterium]
MSKKVYFRYNPSTLTYERVYLTAKERFIGVLQNSISGIVVGIIAYALYSFYFDTPSDKMMKREIDVLSTQNRLISDRLDKALDVMGTMQERDDNLYRVILQSDPSTKNSRNTGILNSSRYDELKGLSNEALIKSTALKMDVLAKQLYLQSKSFDDLIHLLGTREERLLCTPAIQPILNKDLKQLSSGFGIRVDPIYGRAKMHSGMDFTARIGTPIYATGDGRVQSAGWDQGYGNAVLINHGFGYQTKYAHMSRIKSKTGQKVKRGEVIGYVGTTGKSTAPHLHYEVHVNGKPVNPALYYFMDLSPKEYDRMILLSETRGQIFD